MRVSSFVKHVDSQSFKHKGLILNARDAEDLKFLNSKKFQDILNSSNIRRPHIVYINSIFKQSVTQEILTLLKSKGSRVRWQKLSQ